MKSGWAVESPLIKFVSEYAHTRLTTRGFISFLCNDIIKARILVVEDDLATNDLITMNLQVAGCECDSAFDGAMDIQLQYLILRIANHFWLSIRFII